MSLKLGKSLQVAVHAISPRASVHKKSPVFQRGFFFANCQELLAKTSFKSLLGSLGVAVCKLSSFFSSEGSLFGFFSSVCSFLASSNGFIHFRAICAAQIGRATSNQQKTSTCTHYDHFPAFHLFLRLLNSMSSLRQRPLTNTVKCCKQILSHFPYGNQGIL